MGSAERPKPYPFARYAQNVDGCRNEVVMFVSARAEYACLAMMELARRPSDPRPVRLAEITAKHRIPRPFLVQIMLQMKAAGLVHTTRGASGGYRLAKPPEEITLADIFGVLDRLDEAENRPAGDRELAQSLQNVWRRLAKSRAQLLQQITLRELVPSDVAPDYVI